MNIDLYFSDLPNTYTYSNSNPVWAIKSQRNSLIAKAVWSNKSNDTFTLFTSSSTESTEINNQLQAITEHFYNWQSITVHGISGLNLTTDFVSLLNIKCQKQISEFVFQLFKGQTSA